MRVLFKLKNIIKINIFSFLFLLILLSSGIFATTILALSETSSLYINKIEDITVNVNQGDKYQFPGAVQAIMSDNSTKQVSVTWSIDTGKSKSNYYVFEGTVQGYSKKVILKLISNIYIKSIADINATVNQGHSYTLPATVTAKMSNNSNQQVAVTWNPSKADTSKIGKYTFEGTVQGYSKKVILNLTVNIFIKSIADINTAVIHGNSYSLPATVIAKMSDNSNNKVAVTWNPSKVDTSKTGVFTFEGTVQGYDKKVKLTLTVKAYIKSVSDIKVSVYQGANYNLPSTATAKMSDNSIQKVAVTWTPSKADTSTLGKYIFQGIVKGYSKKINLTLTVEQELGNTNGNLVNSGLVSQKSGWTYYANLSDSCKLYKIKNDGTEKTKLSDDKVFYINVVGEYIYYKNESDSGKIYKIKLDGTERTKLNNDASNYINVAGSWIYYKNESDSGKLYKIKLDGTSRTKLNNDSSSYVNVVDDWIYYEDESSDTYYGFIYKIKTDGTGKIRVNSKGSSCISINVAGDWIYYLNTSDSSTIYKMKKDGTGITRVSGANDSSRSINVSGNWIYYAKTLEKGLYKMKLDGTGKVKLTDDISYKVNVVGEWIYYMNGSDNYNLYKIKIDGTGKQIVK